eukprot:3661343-Pleurochrysis_carterae.AAC.1
MRPCLQARLRARLHALLRVSIVRRAVSKHFRTTEGAAATREARLWRRRATLWRRRRRGRRAPMSAVRRRAPAGC